MSAAGQAKIYAMVRDQFVAALEAGTVPWHKSWAGTGMPRSMATGKPYRGVNVWTLMLTAQDKGYTSPWWGTYDQITAKGGQVRKGERHQVVIKWKRYKITERDEATGEDETKIIASMFYFRVFNADQAHGLPASYYGAEAPAGPAEVREAELVIKGYLSREDAPAMAYDGGDRAYYDMAADEIHLPARVSFEDADYLYSTTFHEVTHSTGHESRLDRPGIAQFDHFGSGKYAKEELAAEMGAAYLAATTGVDSHFDNSAAYVAGWLTKLRDDPRVVIQAAAQAQRAADFILGISYDEKEE